MAVTNILDMDIDVRPFFGTGCCSKHGALLLQIRRFTESQARRFVGHGIIQTTYSDEYHPKRSLSGEGSEVIDDGTLTLIGENVYLGQCLGDVAADVLQLSNGYVRSVTSVYEDAGARYGSAGGFAAATQLTEGTDFDLELDNASFSKSGRLIRRNGAWSTIPGTIKVTYSAGLTAAELRGEYLFVKAALLEDMRAKFNYQVAQQQAVGVSGPIRKEKYVGDYEVEYDSGGERSAALSAAVMGDLVPLARARLQSIRRMAL